MIKKFINMRKVRLYIILVVGLLVVACGSIAFVRSAFLANVKESQTAAVTSVANAFMYGEEQSLAAYETVLIVAAQNIDIHITDGLPSKEFLDAANYYFQSVSSMFADDVVSPYIIYNGIAYYSDNRVYDLAEMGYSDAKYYKAMLDAESVVFTDVYWSPEQQSNIITASLKCSNSDVVVAMNIDINHFILNSESLPLSNKSAFYLCDSNGKLISMQGATSTSDVQHAQQLLDGVIGKIKAGDFEKKACHTSYKGEHVGIYYAILPNGWYSIVAAPHDSIVDNQKLIALFFLVCFLAIVFIAYRDLRLSYKADRANDTMRILGNLYYAIYRVNFRNDTYEIIKGSDYVESQLEKKGKYDSFMNVILEVINENARNEFEASFSCDNIRVLVENNVKNFGGDFQRRFDDKEHWVKVRILYDEKISADEVILVFRDNEKEKKHSFNEIKLLQEALETAKISDKARQNFFKNMSHDMRTPLNAIIGLSKLAGEKLDDPEKLSEYINSIHHSGETLLKLINEILDVSKMQDGNILLDYKPIDIKQCISDCAYAFASEAQSENKKFKVTYDITSSNVFGDSLRISQIVNNLLSNAFKFTKSEDTIELCISQKEQEKFSQYIITVSDTGVGMSEDFMLHLFEPYARETMFSDDQIAGTGLGLPITYNIITQMDGQIAVKSELNVGTTFTVTLPFVPVSEVAEEKPEEPLPAPQHVLEGRRILLAEDNILNMEVATEILKMNGAEVVEAWNGKEAVEQFEAAEPYYFDAILLDMNMPVLNGCGAAEKIRSSSKDGAGEVPIVAVTANAFPEDIAATIAAGMNAHISKPIDTAALCQTLQKLFK